MRRRSALDCRAIWEEEEEEAEAEQEEEKKKKKRYEVANWRIL
jgi:hypothetical protein